MVATCCTCWSGKWLERGGSFEASLVGAAELWFESLGGDAYESWDDFEIAIRQRFREDYFDERLEEEL